MEHMGHVSDGKKVQYNCRRVSIRKTIAHEVQWAIEFVLKVESFYGE